jgi:hypothetical protein
MVVKEKVEVSRKLMIGKPGWPWEHIPFSLLVALPSVGSSAVCKETRLA